MSKLVKYFTHLSISQRLPPLPRMYSAEYDVEQLSEDETKLMKMSAIRSPQGVEILKRRRGAGSARELAATLPTHHKPRRGGRLMPLIRRLMGTTAYDPMKRISYMYRHRGR